MTCARRLSYIDATGRAARATESMEPAKQPTHREFSGAFYGSGIKSRTIGPFVLTERIYEPEFATPIHIHTRPLFCIVLDGSYREVHGGKTRDCSAGTMLFHAAQEEHLERFGPSGGRSLIIEMDPAWLCEVAGTSCDTIRQTAAVDAGVLRIAGTKLYREFLDGDEASSLIIEGLLLEMTGEFMRVSTIATMREPYWLPKARALIRASFRGNVTLASIGSAVGVHPVHLAQTFRKFSSCTVGDYVRQLRVEFACDQLCRNDASLADIAGIAGFADQSHFTRTFKRMTGVSPSQYRAAMLRRRRSSPPARSV